MAVTAEISIIDTIKENRWSAEFFDPKYSFEPTNKYKWSRIGNLLKRCQYGISISMNETQNGYPIFRMNEIDNCFLTEAAKYAAISRTEFLAFKLSCNDILFNRTNSFDFVGRTGILKEETDSVFASYLIRVNPNEEYILPEFLTIYLNTPFGIGQIKRRAMHSINQANVSASELKRILIPVIGIHLQQEIADIVNEAFKLKKNSESLYAQAEQLLEQELGLDKIQFDNPIAYESSFSETIDFSRIDGEYFRPRYKQLRMLIQKYQGGYEPLKQRVQCISPNITPTKTPLELFHYIELSNINSQIGIVNGNKEVLGKDVPSRAKRLVSAGDIIASAVVGSVDKAALISESEDGYLASTGFFHFRSDQYSPEYLLILLRSPIMTEQLKQQATGGILSAVSDSNLKHIILPILPDTIQNEITDLVQESHACFRKSQQLLEQAKNRVEELIEQGVN